MPYKDPEVSRIKMRIYHATYAERHPLRVKAKKAAWHANKKAEELGVEGKLTRAEVERLLEEHAVCQLCDSSALLSIDHKKPWKKGGLNHISNIQIICWQCNMKKTYKDSRDSWSVHGESCKTCGTSRRKHEAHGLCVGCYEKARVR